MAIKKCDICGEFISGEEQDIRCPDCMNLYHARCIEERIIQTETITGRKSKIKINYYRCPNCSKEIRNLN